MNRPLYTHYQHFLVPALLLLMAGALSASGLPDSLFWFVWTGIAFGASLLIILFGRHPWLIRWFLWLLAFFAGGAYFMLMQFVPGPEDISRLGDLPRIRLAGTVLESAPREAQWVLQAEQLNGKPVTGHVLAKLPASPDSPPFQVGDRLTLSGSLRVPQGPQFPGDFDYRGYLLQQGVTALVEGQAIQVAAATRPNVYFQTLRLAYMVRERVSRSFIQAIPAPDGAILASIVMGEHAVTLDPAIKTRFIRAGLIHLLAASGFNVGLIAIFFLLIGNLLRLPLRVNLLLAMGGVALYCLLTGLPPSVQRAGLMLELAFLLKLIRRELTPLTLLCLTGALLTLMNPMVVLMTGFQLSFLSTLGLLTMVGPLRDKLGFYTTRWAAGLLLVPLVAQLWVTPILWYDFNQVQLASLPANLVALPWTAILTYLGFLSAGFSLVLPKVTMFVLSGLSWVVSPLRHIATYWGEMPLASLTVAAPPLAVVVMMFLLLGGLAYGLHFPRLFPRKQSRQFVLACLLLMVIPMAWGKMVQTPQVVMTWLPVPQSPSLQVIETGGGSVIVQAQRLNRASARILTTYLRRRGKTHIALLNLFPARMQKLDGLPILLQSVSIGQILVSGTLSDSLWDRLLTAAEPAHIPVLPASPTHLIEVGSLEITQYTRHPQERLQRLMLGNTCFAGYWGAGSFSQSPLYPLGRACAIREEAEGTQHGSPILYWPEQTDTKSLSGFHQLTFSPNQIRFH